jgi:CBS domain-containing protein
MSGKMVHEVMSHDVDVVHPRDTMQVAAEKMRSLNVGSLPVCDGERLVGFITDRDIVVRAVALGHDPHAFRVSDAMSRHLEYCFDDDPLELATRLMRARQIRRLVVLDARRRMVGIVSLGDLARAVGRRDAGETIEEISEPTIPDY